MMVAIEQNFLGFKTPKGDDTYLNMDSIESFREIEQGVTTIITKNGEVHRAVITPRRLAASLEEGQKLVEDHLHARLKQTFKEAFSEVTS